MANIQLKALFDQKKREFKTMGASLDRFELDFVDAVNRATRRINRDADLSSTIAAIDDSDDSITLDAKYEDIVSTIVSLNLLLMGQRPVKGFDRRVRDLQGEVPELIDSIRQDLLHDRQDSDTDDDTYDNVGLGALE